MTFTRGELKVNPMFTHFYMYISILAVKKQICTYKIVEMEVNSYYLTGRQSKSKQGAYFKQKNIKIINIFKDVKDVSLDELNNLYSWMTECLELIDLNYHVHLYSKCNFFFTVSSFIKKQKYRIRNIP